MKKKKRVGIAIKIFIAVFSVYSAFTLVSLQIDIASAREQKVILTEQLELQKVRNAELEHIISAGRSEEYIARIARESLGYIFPGERVFVDISSK